MISPLEDRLSAVLSAEPVPPDAGDSVGRSREGREVRAFRLGTGSLRVSLLGGCHADEPAGPWLLRRLVSYLSSLSSRDDLFSEFEWWVIPHLNPDGEARNRAWHDGGRLDYGVAEYLEGAVREEPGDDVEFCFPWDAGDEGARPENRAAYRWWGRAEGPFLFHASLHGMAVGRGPWFLVDAAWRNRCGHLKERCAARARALGYELHDVERLGEKGFLRLEPGFATRPDSRAMRSYFVGRGDPDTARLFRPSSMETIRSLGGDPLTAVSEVPLFTAPGIGDTLGPPDPVLEGWKERLRGWAAELREASGEAREGAAERVVGEARERGLRAVPARDQMALQWTLVAAGIEQARRHRAGG